MQMLINFPNSSTILFRSVLPLRYIEFETFPLLLFLLPTSALVLPLIVIVVGTLLRDTDMDFQVVCRMCHCLRMSSMCSDDCLAALALFRLIYRHRRRHLLTRRLVPHRAVPQNLLAL